MASTYSTNLKIELIGTGDQSGTWGTTTNTNLGTLIEQAIAGYVTQAVTDGASATVLTIPNGSSSNGRNYVIELTGTLTANRTVEVPAVNKPYIFYNNTTGGFSVTVKVTGQTGVTIANGKKAIVYTNTTDVIEVANAPVTEAGTQTLTNKTLTNPTINGFTGSTAVVNIGSGQFYKDTSGNIGINTTSPNGKLQVTGGTTNASSLATAYSAAAFTLVPKSTSGFSLAFGSGPSDFPYIQMSAAGTVASDMSLQPYGGNLGIGTTSPTAKLHVYAAASTDAKTIVGAQTATYSAWTAYVNNVVTAVGTENSAGGNLVAGSSAYASILSNNGAYPVQFGTNNTVRMTIDSSGNVGIGNNIPGSFAGTVKLVVGSGATTTTPGAITVYSGTATYGGLYFADGTVGDQQYRGAVEYSHSTDALSFYAAGSERARIDSNGNVGIGTQPALASLGINKQTTALSGTSNSYGLYLYPTGTGACNIDAITSSTSNTSLVLRTYNNGTYNTFTMDNGGNVTASGNVTAYSDARLKKNVSTIDKALDLVEKMRGVRYERIEDGKSGVGVIAQEMQEVLPEVVMEGENLSVAYGNIVGVLIEAVKELSARVKELEAK